MTDNIQNGYNVINGDDIDFSRYLDDYPEHPHVIPASMYADRVVEYFHGDNTPGLVLPWEKTQNVIRLRPGEVTVWAGVNGHGKSMLLNQVMLKVMNDEPVCIASMEMKPHITMARMTRQAAGNSKPPVNFIRAFHEWTRDRLFLYTQNGMLTPERIFGVMRLCDEALISLEDENMKKIKIRHFVIDSLMKCGIGEDDYNSQKAFINKLCSRAMDTGMHVHLVAHARKSDSERKIVDKFDIKGTGAITDQVDNVFTVWRNKRKEDDAQNRTPDQKIQDEPDALLICSKQRHGEWEGKIKLWFDKESFQYVGKENDRPMEYFEYNREAYD